MHCQPFSATHTCSICRQTIEDVKTVLCEFINKRNLCLIIKYFMFKLIVLCLSNKLFVQSISIDLMIFKRMTEKQFLQHEKAVRKCVSSSFLKNRYDEFEYKNREKEVYNK